MKSCVKRMTSFKMKILTTIISIVLGWIFYLHFQQAKTQ